MDGVALVEAKRARVGGSGSGSMGDPVPVHQRLMRSFDELTVCYQNDLFRGDDFDEQENTDRLLWAAVQCVELFGEYRGTPGMPRAPEVLQLALDIVKDDLVDKLQSGGKPDVLRVILKVLERANWALSDIHAELVRARSG
jgi:hypothetical protein